MSKRKKDGGAGPPSKTSKATHYNTWLKLQPHPLTRPLVDEAFALDVYLADSPDDSGGMKLGTVVPLHIELLRCAASDADNGGGGGGGTAAAKKKSGGDPQLVASYNRDGAGQYWTPSSSSPSASCELFSVDVDAAGCAIQGTGLAQLRVRLTHATINAVKTKAKQWVYHLRVSQCANTAGAGTVAAIMTTTAIAPVRPTLRVTTHPADVWYKDEGGVGVERSVSVGVTVCDQYERRDWLLTRAAAGGAVNNSKTGVLVGLTLLYENGGAVAIPSLLRVIGTTSCTLLSGAAAPVSVAGAADAECFVELSTNAAVAGRDAMSLKFRVEDVSSNHRMQPFRLKLTVVAATSAASSSSAPSSSAASAASSAASLPSHTALSNPVMVRSKRNKKKTPTTDDATKETKTKQAAARRLAALKRERAKEKARKQQQQRDVLRDRDAEAAAQRSGGGVSAYGPASGTHSGRTRGGRRSGARTNIGDDDDDDDDGEVGDDGTSDDEDMPLHPPSLSHTISHATAQALTGELWRERERSVASATPAHDQHGSGDRGGGGVVGGSGGAYGDNPSLNLLTSWMQFVVAGFRHIEWQHVGFEVNDDGSMNLHRPVYRCPGCWQHKDTKRPGIHQPNCPVYRSLFVYQSRTQGALRRLLRSCASVDVAAAATAAGVSPETVAAAAAAADEQQQQHELQLQQQRSLASLAATAAAALPENGNGSGGSGGGGIMLQEHQMSSSSTVLMSGVGGGTGQSLSAAASDQLPPQLGGGQHGIKHDFMKRSHSSATPAMSRAASFSLSTATAAVSHVTTAAAAAALPPSLRGNKLVLGRADSCVEPSPAPTTQMSSLTPMQQAVMLQAASHTLPSGTPSFYPRQSSAALSNTHKALVPLTSPSLSYSTTPLATFYDDPLAHDENRVHYALVVDTPFGFPAYAATAPPATAAADSAENGDDQENDDEEDSGEKKREKQKKAAEAAEVDEVTAASKELLGFYQFDASSTLLGFISLRKTRQLTYAKLAHEQGLGTLDKNIVDVDAWIEGQLRDAQLRYAAHAGTAEMLDMRACVTLANLKEQIMLMHAQSEMM